MRDERFYQQKGMGTEKLYWAKKWLVMARLLSFRGWCLVFARLLSFRGWWGPVRKIISLVLIRQFLIDWFEILFLGNAETIIKSSLSLVVWDLA